MCRASSPRCDRTKPASSSCAWIRRVGSIPRCARSSVPSWPRRYPLSPTWRRAARAPRVRAPTSPMPAPSPPWRPGPISEPRRPFSCKGCRCFPAGSRNRLARAMKASRPPGAGNAGSAASTEPEDTESRKILNDAVAYIRSLAELNGRNADWAAEAVRSAVSLSAADALKLHVIDAIAVDVPDLLRQIDGRTVKVAGKPELLATAGLDVVTVAPDWRTQLLAVITDPNIAYLLMLLGAYGLIFELVESGHRSAGHHRRDQPAGGAVRPQPAADRLRRHWPRSARHRPHGRRSLHRHVRRAWGWRDRRVHFRVGHDVPWQRVRVRAVDLRGDRRHHRQRRFLPPGYRHAAAFAAPAGRHRRRGADRRHGRGSAVGRHRGQGAGQRRDLAGALPAPLAAGSAHQGRRARGPGPYRRAGPTGRSRTESGRERT